MSNTEAKNIILSSGLKSYAVACAIGLNPSLFSAFLTGRRKITAAQQERLDNYLSKVQEML